MRKKEQGQRQFKQIPLNQIEYKRQKQDRKELDFALCILLHFLFCCFA